MPSLRANTCGCLAKDGAAHTVEGIDCREGPADRSPTYHETAALVMEFVDVLAACELAIPAISSADGGTDTMIAQARPGFVRQQNIRAESWLSLMPVQGYLKT